MDIPTNWTFKDRDVVDEFDRHVREQLPWYELATGMIAHCVRHYLPNNGLMYDLGCATGNIELSLQDILEKRNATFVPIDNSAEMSESYRGNSPIVIQDIQDYMYEPFDVCICFLVLMFLTPLERWRLVQKLYSNIKKGGCLIIFDKTQINSGYLSTVFHRITIAGKAATGTPSDEIIAKELSLGGVQRPLPHNFLKRLADNERTEHRCIEPVEIFRFGEFVGWIVEGPE